VKATLRNFKFLKVAFTAFRAAGKTVCDQRVFSIVEHPAG